MKNLKDYIVIENNFFKNLGVGNIAIIKNWLRKNCQFYGKYTINDDFTIDTDCDVYLDNYDGEELPYYIQFGKVSCDFYITNTNLKTLRGCPKICGLFDCSCNKKLETLVGGPEYCEIFNCHGCTKLKSLEGISPDSKYVDCGECGGKFTERDVKKFCKLVEEIYC